MWKKLLLAVLVLIAVGAGVAWTTYQTVLGSLPPHESLKDYSPLLVTQVYDRKGHKIGEFFYERRVLVPYDKIPRDLINAFVAAEDAEFFQHKGVNWMAIMRAFIANLKAGQTVQGGSTITQQVAKTLLLTSERTYDRKAREILLAQRMEENLSKQDILYLYLNQIFFGQNAHGIAMAAETYFRKPLEKLTLAEMAILAGLPKAPSAYSPVRNPQRAKERQVYVLNRMAEVGFITKEQAQNAANEPVKVYMREDYQDKAPHFLETVRLMLVAQLGEETVLKKGLRVETSLDLEKQLAAQEAAVQGLKALDKRQGYRGPLENITDPKAVGEFLLKSRNQLIQEVQPERTIQPSGHFVDYGPLNLNYDYRKGLPFYLKPGQTAKAVVSKVDDQNGLVFVRVAELEGLIDIDTMTWARKPNPEKRWDYDTIRKPSQALKMGDVILVKVAGPQFVSDRLAKAAKKKTKDATAPALPDFSRYISLELDQEPVAEAALISFDQNNQDILAMVGGGSSFEKSKFNRAIQAARQTGSSFKAIVYAAALDKGYTPATPIMDAPIVYDDKKDEDEEGQEESKVWKPTNHSKSFGGDIIFRNALVKSLNIPSVKIIEDITVPYSLDYSKRMGIHSNLNPDFTLVLGSSSVTLYEMTKAFAHFGRLGKRLRPVVIHKVEDHEGTKLLENLTLDLRFEKEIRPIEDAFEKRRKEYLAQRDATEGESQGAETLQKGVEPHIFFDNPDQIISPQTAYLMTSLLRAVVEDRNGTGGKARALGREVAGKTGSTNGYFDAWFIGYTQQIATGVWVGFDQERSLGRGEVGGRAALPIWVDYMKSAHEGLPLMTFPVPEGIVFANIDGETGELATSTSKNIIRQAFKEGTEPTSNRSQKEEDTDFYKQDLSE